MDLSEGGIRSNPVISLEPGVVAEDPEPSEVRAVVGVVTD